MNDDEKMAVYQILKDVGFYNMKHTIGLKSDRMQNAIRYLPKAIERILVPLIPRIENIEGS